MNTELNDEVLLMPSLLMPILSRRYLISMFSMIAILV